MAYQALLFCPDEKTARTLTQVLSELEFTVEPCAETFAAVKKLMGEHFDAVVVDCDNEQNAALLFKSARNSTSNQASLAVAVVEGQAGVAKAFRIGANLVLTKPINVEQAKGTLRVARGLLRKGETAKTTTPAAPTSTASRTPAPVAKPPAVVPPRPVAARPSAPPVTNAPSQDNSGLMPVPVAVPPAARPMPTVVPPAATLQPAASSAVSPSAETKPAAKPSGFISPSTSDFPAGSFGGGAASAPAPAREAQPVPAPEPETVAAPNTLDSSAAVIATASNAIAPLETASSNSPAASFTFGGANAPEESSGSKKIIFGLVAVVLLGAVLYAARGYFIGSSSQSANQTVPAPKPSSTQPPAASSLPSPSATAPAAKISTQAPPAAASPSEQAATETEPVASESTNNTTTPEKNVTPSGKTSPTAPSAAAPRVVKAGAVPKLKSQPVAAEAAAPPSAFGLDTSASAKPLPNLGSSTSGPKPVLQRLNISQGVSVGLLVKKVEPVYPANAMHLRIEGAVQLLATISKTGDITEIKVLKGDPQLTRAATDAVKRWKYQPYLLNGEPVEIQTQVTLNFRLPR